MTKEQILAILKRWYVQVAMVLLVCLAAYYTAHTTNEDVLYFSISIPVFLLLVSIGVGIIRLVKKQYLSGSLQLITTLIVAVIFVFYMSFYIMYYPLDFYADNLKIPENIELEKPLNELTQEYRDSLLSTTADNGTFVLAQSGQPGIYEYAAWLNLEEKGKIYLKAFEITKEDQLSAQRLKERSAAVVTPGGFTGYNKEIMIYEGDWGKPYAARFELWFDSDAKELDSLLLSKNYIIEGWMR